MKTTDLFGRFRRLHWSITAAEGVLWAVGIGFPMALPLWLAIDFLLLSPFKLARRLWFGADTDTRRIVRQCLFLNYGKSLAWRGGLWLRRLAWYWVFGLPAACLIALGKTEYMHAATLTDSVVGCAALLTGWAARLAAVVLAELWLLRYAGAPYFLRISPPGTCFSASRRALAGQCGTLIGLHGQFAVHCAARLFWPFFSDYAAFEYRRTAYLEENLCKTGNYPHRTSCNRRKTVVE